MPSGPPAAGRRYDVPPLWTVPFLLIVAIAAGVAIGAAYGLLGALVSVVVIVWLQQKADAYVRGRDRE